MLKYNCVLEEFLHYRLFKKQQLNCVLFFIC